jgi:hypothetical protein
MATVSSSGTAKVTLPTDEQILITREFDAPKELVFRAWTTPELVRRWISVIPARAARQARSSCRCLRHQAISVAGSGVRALAARVPRMARTSSSPSR